MNPTLPLPQPAGPKHQSQLINYIDNCPPDVHRLITLFTRAKDDFSLAFTSKAAFARFFELALLSRPEILLVLSEKKFSDSFITEYCEKFLPLRESAPHELFKRDQACRRGKYQETAYLRRHVTNPRLIQQVQSEKINSALAFDAETCLREDYEEQLNNPQLTPRQRNVLRDEKIKEYIFAEMISAEYAKTLTPTQVSVLCLKLIRNAIFSIDNPLDIHLALGISERLYDMIDADPNPMCGEFQIQKYELSVLDLINTEPNVVSLLLRNFWIDQKISQFEICKKDILGFTADQAKIFIFGKVWSVIDTKKLGILNIAKSEAIVEFFRPLTWHIEYPSVHFDLIYAIVRYREYEHIVEHLDEMMDANVDAVRFLHQNPWAAERFSAEQKLAIMKFDSDKILALGTKPVQQAFDAQALTWENLNVCDADQLNDKAMRYIEAKDTSSSMSFFSRLFF